MPQWIKDVAPIVAVISIFVNIFLFLAKRRLEIKDKEQDAAREAELDRQRVSREIAGKLAAIFNPYTAETIKTLSDIQKLRTDWGAEGMLIDLVHDEATGRKLTALVTEYLDATLSHIQGNITAADLHTRRSENWRQARAALESFVGDGQSGALTLRR